MTQIFATIGFVCTVLLFTMALAATIKFAGDLTEAFEKAQKALKHNGYTFSIKSLWSFSRDFESAFFKAKDNRNLIILLTKRVAELESKLATVNNSAFKEKSFYAVAGEAINMGDNVALDPDGKVRRF